MMPSHVSRSSRRCLSLGAVSALALMTSTAQAHIALTDPPARYDQSHQKNWPCGNADNPPGDGPAAILQGGETITLTIDEFIGHTGHFRVAIAPSDQEFVDPTSFEDFYSDPNVVLDDVEDTPGGGMHMIDVTIPDIDCDPCVMQVMQIMNDGSFGPGTSDFYYQCADIVIESSGAGTSGTTGAETTGPGGSTGDAGSTGLPGGADGSTSGNATNADTGDSSPGTASDTNSDDSDGSTSGAPATDGATDGATAAEETEDSGCGCRSGNGSAPAAVLALLALVGLRRRRP